MKCQSLYPIKRTRSGGDSIGVTVGIISLLLNLGFNSALVYTLVKLKLLKKPTFIFYFFMALSDLCIAVFLQPLLLYLCMLPQATCTVADVIGQFMALSLCEFSGMMIVLVAFDRYHRVVWADNYNTFMSKRRALTLVFLAAVICFIIGAVSVIAALWLFVFELMLFLSVTNAAVLLVVCLLYVKGYQRLRSQVLVATAVEVRVARHVAAILFTLCICYVPTLIAQPLWAYSKYAIPGSPSNAIASFVAYTPPLVVLNSILNTAILISSSREIKEFMKGKFAFMQRWRGVVSMEIGHGNENPQEETH